MAANPQPHGEQPFLDSMVKLEAGALAKGALIGLAHFTYATLHPKYQTAYNAAGAFKTADAALSAAYLGVERASDEVGDFLGTAADTFKKFYGKTWSPAWIVTGFDNNSRAVPRRPETRRDCLEKVVAFLTATPTRENAPMGVTAALGEGLLATLKAAILAIPDKESELGAKKLARDNAMDALRKEASGMVAELTGLLGPNDPLWDAFGLNRPGAASPAARVENLRVSGAPGGFIAIWDASANGHLYHVLIRIVAVDTDFRNVKTTTDLDALITGIASGSVVDVCVTAFNESGSESPRSEVVQLTIA